MPITSYRPPLVAPNGKPWNVYLLQGDDWIRNQLQALPWFVANWANQFVRYPNASCNTPLCFPGRAATYTGWRVERHDCVDNNSGARYLASGAINHTLPVVLERVGYFNGWIGKIYNGLGEGGAGGFGTLPCKHPGVHYMAGQWGAPNYFDWQELGTDGTVRTTHGTSDTHAVGDETTATDYAIDVERLRLVEFLDSVPAGRPWCLIHASKATHQDGSSGGLPIPPDRYSSATVTLREDGAFGLDLTTVGHGSWAQAVAVSPWNATAVSDARNFHRESLRTGLALDDFLKKLRAELVARNMLDNTLVVLSTDNAHSVGECQFDAKGVPHPSATDKVLMVHVPGQAGGECWAPVSDIDIAPFIYEMTGARPTIAPHGMSFAATVRDKSLPHRQAAPISNPEKDSPTFSALQFGGAPAGRMFYRLGADSNKGAGQRGGYADPACTTNVITPGDEALLDTLQARRS